MDELKIVFQNTLINEKHGIVYGTTRSGKTYRVSEFIQLLSGIVIFVNTQEERKPEQYSDIIVHNNNEIILALEKGYKKICVTYSINWSDREYQRNQLDQLIEILFTIARDNNNEISITLIIDELDSYISRHVITPAIDNLFNRGLRYNIKAIGIAHLPTNIHVVVKGACSWFLYFEQSDEAVKYFQSKSLFVMNKLRTVSFNNYEGYYREKQKFRLFCDKEGYYNEQQEEKEKLGTEEEQEEEQEFDRNIEDNLSQQQMHEPGKMGNSDKNEL